MATNFRYFRADPSIGHQRLREFSGFEVSGGTGSAWILEENAVTIGEQVAFNESSLWSFGNPVVGLPY